MKNNNKLFSYVNFLIGVLFIIFSIVSFIFLCDQTKVLFPQYGYFVTAFVFTLFFEILGIGLLVSATICLHITQIEETRKKE